MIRTDEREFHHACGIVTVFREESGNPAVSVDDLRQQFRFDEPTRRYLVRYPSFPSVVGYDEKLEIAAEKALGVLRDYIGNYLRVNGYDGFVQHLGDLGFNEVMQDEPWKAVSIAEISSRHFTVDGGDGI